MKIQPPVDIQSAASSSAHGTRRPDSAGAPHRDAGQVQGGEAAPSQASAVGIGSFDAAKVDAIKQAIAEGRLSVNASVVADRLIADARALADKGHA
ncbi:MAG TPA: flagellar biosynthesis anti-sigma factor FlgM [Casimicrobiaceae bacterium]|nr:flagellar biosynthesis anti-sigma factor FlgM [Casimicrobiaceae bacterium]